MGKLVLVLLEKAASKLVQLERLLVMSDCGIRQLISEELPLVACPKMGPSSAQVT